MTRTASIPFTALELAQLAHALTDATQAGAGFLRFGAVHDAAFTTALLKVARGRVALGEIKGVDLDLPPWAAAAILDAMAPAADVTLSPLPKAKPTPPRRERRARTRRAPRAPRLLPGAGSVADADRLADADPLDDEAAS